MLCKVLVTLGAPLRHDRLSVYWYARRWCVLLPLPSLRAAAFRVKKAFFAEAGMGGLVGGGGRPFGPSQRSRFEC